MVLASSRRLGLGIQLDAAILRALSKLGLTGEGAPAIEYTALLASIDRKDMSIRRVRVEEGSVPYLSAQLLIGVYLFMSVLSGILIVFWDRPSSLALRLPLLAVSSCLLGISAAQGTIHGVINRIYVHRNNSSDGAKASYILITDSTSIFLALSLVYAALGMWVALS